MIIAIMTPSLIKIGILIDFKINQEFIAKVLCLKKDEPITICNGQCYLSEQLKKIQEQEEQQTPTNTQERLELVYYYHHASSSPLAFVDTINSKSNSTYVVDFYASSFIADVFHPPKQNLV